MTKQNPRDQISKASWMLLDSIKTAVSTNVLTATQSGQINKKDMSLERLLHVIEASIEEGYHRAHKTFMLEVDKSLTTVEFPPLTKKKNT